MGASGVAVLASIGFSPLYGLLYLILFGGVLGMAYWTTRWVSRTYGRTFGTQIRIIDRLPVGADRNFLMLRVGGRHYFLYQDRNGVRLLDRLEGYQPEPAEQDAGPMPFQELLDKIKMRKQG